MNRIKNMSFSNAIDLASSSTQSASAGFGMVALAGLIGQQQANASNEPKPPRAEERRMSPSTPSASFSST